ncbi:MAG: GIY-YIG nuclease family protein [Bacteroidota bacterium]
MENQNGGFFVYVLESERTGRKYTGSTANLERRLGEHNRGETRSTRGKGPWKVVHQESFGTREEAEKREKYLKSGAGREKLERILGWKNS